jgi:dihydrofolate synthase/folylpolyglutamate synthase
VTPYEQLLARLLPARRFGVVLGLERMHAIFARLGHPEQNLGRVIHVGGTNGKGSTAGMIAQLLAAETAADRPARVAIYTSPHLSCLRERIRFDDEMITEDAIVAAADRVRAAGGDELTFFEQLTAIACVAIAGDRARGVDFTVLEVGLGGRLDATNAVRAEVAVVTGVAMDHGAILGDTLEKIAREKAGIFKRGQKIVIGASGEPAAVPVLAQAARAAGAKEVVVVDDAAIAAVQAMATAHLGGYQQRNAAAAIAAVTALDRWVLRTTIPYLRTPPGRFEVIERDDLDVILDGAHNPHAAAALAGELRARGLRPTLIVAISSDKDVAGIAAALAPICVRVIATRYQQDRSFPPGELAAVFHAAGPTSLVIETAPDLASAIAMAGDPTAPANRDFARTLIQTRPTILVTGSLFLVGEARTLLLGAPTDPYVVTDPPATGRH